MEMRERFLGCVMGHMVGDGLGAPFEGLTSDWIYGQFGRVSDIVAKPPLETLCYTDDTEMSGALGESLLAEGRVVEEKLVRVFAQAYDPRRGYGQGMRRLFETEDLETQWRELGLELFPGGSYGNGAAMRVGPVAMAFYRDLDRVWEEAGRSAFVTHQHPLGIEGAQLLATAIAMALRGDAGDHDYFFAELQRRATQEEYQWALGVVGTLTERDSLHFTGNSLEAHRSVVTSIACFGVAPDSYEKAIGKALAQGNDTDTLMAMTGAISGAHLGISAVSGHLIEMLENGERGRDYMRGLAERMYARFGK